MLKNKKGISLTTMVITVMILLVIMGTLAYSALDSVKIRRLNKLYNDLRQLNDAVEIYYLKNGQLPIDTTKDTIEVSSLSSAETNKIDFVLKDDATESITKDSFKNPNDYDAPNGKAVYKYLDLKLLNNISLGYPDNDYLINIKSHTIYNFTGVKLDGEVYNALPLDYKDINYNEEHPVTAIRLKEVTGLSKKSGSDNIIYYATNLNQINLKDYLIFDSNGSNGLGEPKTVKFFVAVSPIADYLELEEDTGILKKKSGTNIPFDAGDLVIKAKTTNYNNSTEKEISLKIQFASIELKKDSESVTSINLLAKQTQATYVTKKETDEIIASKGGVLATGTLNMTTISDDSEIATASSSNGTITVNSGTKSGSTHMEFEVTDRGRARASLDVNVFDYKLYAGSAGSNTNISSLDITGIGDSSKTNVKFNLDGPTGSGITTDIAWDLVIKNEDNTYSTDTSGIVTLSVSSDKTTATLTPAKIGTTYLRCTFSVNSETLGVSVIPIIVSGLVDNSDNIIANDTISITKANASSTGAVFKYLFGDSSISPSTATYTVEVTPTSNVTCSNSNNVITVKYSGTSDVTLNVTVKAKVGTKEYIDTLQVKVAN